MLLGSSASEEFQGSIVSQLKEQSGFQKNEMKGRQEREEGG